MHQLPDPDGGGDRAHPSRTVGGGVVEAEPVGEGAFGKAPVAMNGSFGVERCESGQQGEDGAEAG